MLFLTPGLSQISLELLEKHALLGVTEQFCNVHAFRELDIKQISHIKVLNTEPTVMKWLGST